MLGVVQTVISSVLQILALMSEWQDENHKKTHLKLATSYLRDTANMWKKVFWSYETNIELFDLHANTMCGGSLSLNIPLNPLFQWRNTLVAPSYSRCFFLQQEQANINGEMDGVEHRPI